MRVVVRLALGMLPLASFAVSLFSLETVEPERWFQTARRSCTREKAKWSPRGLLRPGRCLAPHPADPLLLSVPQHLGQHLGAVGKAGAGAVEVGVAVGEVNAGFAYGLQAGPAWLGLEQRQLLEAALQPVAAGRDDDH